MALTQVTKEVLHSDQSNITVLGTLESLTVSGNATVGNLSATNLTGTLLTASQPSITSVGTLTGLTVSGAPVPNANVSVNLGSTSAWWDTLYANTHVGNTATFTGLVTAANISISSGGSVSRMNMITNSGTGIFNYSVASGYRWFEAGNNGTPSMMLSGGDLGIGTSNPGYKFHVREADADLATAFQSLANTAASIRFVNQSTFNMFVGTESSTGGFIFSNTAPFSAVIGHHGAYPLSLCTNLREQVRIDAFGNVGINTTNPTERLQVAGNVQVSGNVKFTGWQIYEQGTKLFFAYNGAVKMSLTTTGNLTVTGDVTAFGTP